MAVREYYIIEILTTEGKRVFKFEEMPSIKAKPDVIFDHFRKEVYSLYKDIEIFEEKNPQFMTSEGLLILFTSDEITIRGIAHELNTEE